MLICINADCCFGSYLHLLDGGASLTAAMRYRLYKQELKISSLKRENHFFICLKRARQGDAVSNNVILQFLGVATNNFISILKKKGKLCSSNPDLVPSRLKVEHRNNIASRNVRRTNVYILSVNSYGIHFTNGCYFDQHLIQANFWICVEEDLRPYFRCIIVS